MSQYGRANNKIHIGSIDEPGLVVHAQYNPKELQVDRSVPWSPTGEANKANAKTANAQNSGIHLEFTGAAGRELSVEMFFDGYESAAGDGFKVDVAGEVAKLEKLASVRNPGSNEEDFRRPHHCVCTWGTTLIKFKCVITSLSTKYTMFDTAGNPLRATCTVKLKEADSVKAKGSK